MEIKTSKIGAELTSIIYDGKERLHDAKTFWDHHSPVLFPIVGKLRYDKTLIYGQEYAIQKHGFVSDKEFEQIGEHSYKFVSNPDTLKQYPFDFELYIWYTIDKNKLVFNYKIVNKTKDKEMLCGFGGHPAFKCNYSNEKYTLEFETEQENIEIIPVDISVCLLSNERDDVNKFMKDKKILPIKKDSFKNDAIILSKMKTHSVTMKEDGKSIFKFDFPKFDYLGVWSQENAPFVCLEPWYNTPDYVDSTIEFKEKKNIIKIEPNGEFNLCFSVEFY